MSADAQPAIRNLRSFQEVKAMPPSYLWEPYLRAGNLNIIRGDGGSGKTMLAMAILAAITCGVQPDGMPGVLNCDESSSVIYYGSEDDPEENRYRLDRCGCDAGRVFTVSALDMPSLRETQVIRKDIQQVRARLIVFDPVQAFLSGIDMNKAGEVRPILEGLREICRETGCAAILIEHLNKAENMLKAAYRGIGSVDFTNAARSVLMVKNIASEPGARAAIHIKNNASQGRSIKFNIDSEGCFTWEGECDATEEGVSIPPARALTSPVLVMVRHLMGKHPDGWRGTPTQMIAECASLPSAQFVTESVSIGKSLPGLLDQLHREGISYTKKGREYCFYKEARP